MGIEFYVYYIPRNIRVLLRCLYSGVCIMNIVSPGDEQTGAKWVVEQVYVNAPAIRNDDTHPCASFVMFRIPRVVRTTAGLSN